MQTCLDCCNTAITTHYIVLQEHIMFNHCQHWNNVHTFLSKCSLTTCPPPPPPPPPTKVILCVFFISWTHQTINHEKSFLTVCMCLWYVPSHFITVSKRTLPVVWWDLFFLSETLYKFSQYAVLITHHQSLISKVHSVYTWSQCIIWICIKLIIYSSSIYCILELVFFYVSVAGSKSLLLSEL